MTNNMQIFITGTDTNIGKTIIASWLALHSGYSYFKPIQAGTQEDTDSMTVHKLTNATIYPETYCYAEAASPHLAARLENDTIDIDKIMLPAAQNLIVEGAGGLLVPINEKYLVIDLIKKLQLPVILVARTRLGTINHTLLSLRAMAQYDINVLGVIMNGEYNEENKKAIEFYGKTLTLAEFPYIPHLDQEQLKQIPLTNALKKIMMG